VSPEPRKVAVQVDGRQLTLSNLGKPLYPRAGFTKGQVIDYYTRIAPVLLPHLHGRPLTFKRYPDGVDGKFFFEKNAPSHAPAWVRRVRLPTPGSSKGREITRFAVVDDLPTLVWAANLATLELHVPMWRIDPRGTPLDPDLMVFDLDPGPPATIVECCRVGLLLRDALAEDGLSGWPKTSGSKGMQVYVPLPAGASATRSSAYAKSLAQRLERDRPELVLSLMRKDLRGGKVFVDWSQNNAAKTTVAVYSLRARDRPSVSTPLRWDEVTATAAQGDPQALVFTSDEVLKRVEDAGDLFVPQDPPPQRLPE
jgi:bifunctional non-homologous end joining protein LigD